MKPTDGIVYGMFDLIDEAMAYELGVETEEYIEKVEKTTPKRAELIILAIMSEDPKMLEKAKRIFKLI